MHPFFAKKWVNTLDSIRYRLLLGTTGKWPNLGSLLIAFVVTFTVAGSLALGIALAYSSVLALLHAFAYSSRKPATRLVLVASENHASGD